MEISDLLAFTVKNKASDLHLSAGLPPMIRVHGDIRRINLPPLAHHDVHDMVYDIMNDYQRKIFEDTFEADFSFEVPGVARFRVNVFVQNRGIGAVFRVIPSRVLSLEDLGAPRIFKDIGSGACVHERFDIIPVGGNAASRTGEHCLRVQSIALGLANRWRSDRLLHRNLRVEPAAQSGQR